MTSPCPDRRRKGNSRRHQEKDCGDRFHCTACIVVGAAVIICLGENMNGDGVCVCTTKNHLLSIKGTSIIVSYVTTCI